MPYVISETVIFLFENLNLFRKIDKGIREFLTKVSQFALKNRQLRTFFHNLNLAGELQLMLCKLKIGDWLKRRL